MKTDDDDFLTGDVPDPDAEPTAAELAHAKAFADLVDKTLASGRMPPAMSTDDRALLEVATVIRATHGALPLAPSKQRSVVEDALRLAIGGGNAATSLSGAPVIPIKRRWLPWAVASATSLVAAAAIVLLVIRKPQVPVLPNAPTASIPLEWKSRPTDALIGQISSECEVARLARPPTAPALHSSDLGPAIECAKEATVKTSARIDTIFSDRLAGYRDRRFGGKR